MVATLHDLYPDHPVVGDYHYRGYGPQRRPARGAAVLDDALTLHDALVERLAPAGVVCRSAFQPGRRSGGAGWGRSGAVGSAGRSW